MANCTACTGGCCAVFVLSGVTMDEYQADPTKYLDGQYIADMVIPLTTDQARQRLTSLDLHPWWHDDLDDGGPYYTCRHWDEHTRLCTAYDDRPAMCRDYPYDRECDYACGFTPPSDVVAKWVAKHTPPATGGDSP